MSSTRTLPLLLPGVYQYLPGQSSSVDVDTGGYDFLIGGHGFRYATDQQNPYSRVSEPITVHRFDNSLEPGEQTLAPMPWVKAQASFHGGAGQLNLEQGLSAFEYQQEKVEHIRFDTCLGVDVWTPGKVSRLPATTISSPGNSTTCFVAASVFANDYVIAGGTHSLYQMSFPSGPDSAATFTNIDLSGATFGGASNCTVQSIVTDGTVYYALIQLTVDGSNVGVRTLIVRGLASSTSAPTAIYKSAADGQNHNGALGWAKARLVAGLDHSLYELDATVGSLTALPAAKYTNPSIFWSWTTFADSPSAILASGTSGNQSTILSFTLDSSGAVPTLTGGATVAVLPKGEVVNAMSSMLGSFLALGTTRGVRIGTFDTYTGALKYGPLSVTTTAPVYGLAGRDRFVYAGYTNQQANGKTGLVRVDLSFLVDASGRNAFAPDLRPPTSAATGLGTVVGVDLLPVGNRIVWYSTDGFHVEGGAPSSDGDAWLRTSRIRYDTTENKLFKSARITGTLDSASITVTAQTPFDGSFNLGTFGFLTTGDPGEFNLPDILSEWMQVTFALNGASCVFSSYQVKAYPAPKRHYIITITANCFLRETDRNGVETSDGDPRTRYQNVRALEDIGNEVRYVEFTTDGPIAERVLIEQSAFQAFSRPNVEDDLGGYLTLRLRTTQ